jgi:hypothetical protein
MAPRATVAIPKKYLWLVVGFGIGSYIGFAELADLLAKIGGDVKGAVVDHSEPVKVATIARSAPRPSTLRFYRTPEAS